MPQMVFEYILKKNGIDPKTDLSIDQSINFGLTAAAFPSSDADYSVEFEPFATTLETEGNGYVVASLGEESGYVPYTAYSAKKSYLETNPQIIQKFTNAIQKGLNYVNSHTPEEIAKTIQPQFKETSLEALTTIVKRYQDQDTWKEDTVFEEESFLLLQNILEDFILPISQQSEQSPAAPFIIIRICIEGLQVQFFDRSHHLLRHLLRGICLSAFHSSCTGCKKHYYRQ